MRPFPSAPAKRSARIPSKTAEQTTRSARISKPPTRFSENPKENLGKEPTGAELIPGNSSEEATSETGESDEDIELSNKPLLKKQQEQLRHIYDLIEDVDSKIQTVRDEQKVIEDNKENEHREHNLNNTRFNLSGWMTKDTSLKTYLKQPNIGTSPSDDLAELQSSSTGTSIRNTTNNERHTDYELKAANKTFRSTRQDENNSSSETNNKETFNPKPLSLNEGLQHFLEDIFKHLKIDGQQEQT
jgi:TolA-binding protein